MYDAPVNNPNCTLVFADGAPENQIGFEGRLEAP